MHVRLSVESYDAWRAFAALYGVSMSAVVEAMGERFAQIMNDEGGPLTKAGVDIVRRAREIDQRHRSRRGD